MDALRTNLPSYSGDQLRALLNASGGSYTAAVQRARSGAELALLERRRRDDPRRRAAELSRHADDAAAAAAHTRAQYLQGITGMTDRQPPRG